MGIQENKELVKHGYDQFITGNVPAVLDTYADNIEWVSTQAEGIPFSGTYRGKEGVAEFFKRMRDSTETLQFEPNEYIAEGDKVVAMGHSTRKARSTGLTYSTPWVHVLTVREGKVVRFEVYDNSAAVLAAFTGKSK